MKTRLSRRAMGVLVVAAVALTAGRAWAVFHQLPPSKDEWGLKYDVQLSAVDNRTVNVAFTLADEGRLKSIYSATVVAFSYPDGSGSRSYLVKSVIDLKPTEDGKRAGQVQIPREFLDRAMVRILTLNVDGRRQTAGAAYYDIPLKKYLSRGSVVTSPSTPRYLAAPPTPVIKK